MADNKVTQASTLATLPDGTRILTVEADFSGQTGDAGIGVLAKSSGAEGSRVLTLIEPAEAGKQDTGNTSLASIDTKTPALGQALAAGSVPVVLTAAQLTTLTPPAAISGFATEATLSTLNGKVTAVDTGAVVVSSSALPSGAATSAKQDTGNTSLSSIDTKLGTIDDPVATIGATPLMRVAVFDASNTQVTSFGGAGGSGTEYTEDAAAAANPVGPMTMARRKDSLSATEVSADGDNIAVNATSKGEVYVKHTDTIAVTQSGTWDEVGINDSGNSITVDNPTLSVVGGGTEATALRVTIASDSTGVLSVDDNGSTLSIDDGAGSITVDGSVAVTNAGTFVTQENGSALTALQLIDDIVYTDDTSTHATGTSKGALLMAAATPTDASVNANDIGAVAMTTDRKLHVSVQDALPSGTNAIGKLAANSGVDIGDVDVTSLPALPAGNNNIGDVDVASIAAGTNTIGGTTGALAHDDANTSANKPTVGGFEAIAHGANPTAVAAADVTKWYANRHGIPFVINGHPNAKSATYLWTGSTTDDNVLAAISSGTKYAITRISVFIDSATTVSVAVRLGFGTANVPALPAANADAVDDILCYHPGLVPGAGFQIGDGSAILGVGADGAELRVTAGATTGGTGVITVTYFTIES